MKIGQLDIRLPKVAPVSKASRSRKIALVLVSCVALLIWAKPMGLLLWARIRILTSIPKTAIAEPALAANAKPSQPGELDPKLPNHELALRDPFSVDARVFPLPKQGGDTAAGQATTPPPTKDDGETAAGGEGDGDGSQAGEAESTAPSRYEAMRLSAETIRVQSAGAGLAGAVIDNKAVRVGESVTAPDGTEFTLLSVLDGGVVLGRDGREFTVRMPVTPVEPKAIKPAPKSGGAKP